jgi:VanZ family protein
MIERETATGTELSPELRQWMPILLWACAIFIFSTSGFSAANTSRVISPVLCWAVPDISIAWLDLANTLIRKCAHFTEYGVLFWLLVRGPMRGRPLVAMAICVAYALTDEGHQIFVAGRTASIFDVALDSTGAMFSGFLRAAISEII